MRPPGGGPPLLVAVRGFVLKGLPVATGPRALIILGVGCGFDYQEATESGMSKINIGALGRRKQLLRRVHS